ncbi:hypothetical protein BJ165DRAFT_1445948 [Panaeolus papilionaceus]|nr:hypothetical protein BJ165DRAFT_1445948 [Panaeolus papilionaceus]
MGNTRMILVDDTSPLIQYDGAWFTDTTGSQDTQGNYGPVFNKTLHRTVANTTFSFAYTGTSIIVLGTNNLRNDTGTFDPQWECTVDGTLLPSTPYQFAENNWSLCSTGSTPIENEDGPHTLTVKVTVRQNQTFWLDRLLYTPSSSVPLDDKTIFVDNNDPAIVYSPGWGGWGGAANGTQDIPGVSVSWFAYIATEPPHVAADATFSIDGNLPTKFTINALPPNKVPTQYNQRLFTTPTLPAGPHKMDVVFLGSGNTTALILDSLVVQNGTVATVQTPPSTANSSSQGPTPSPTQTMPGHPGGVNTSITATIGRSSTGGQAAPPSSTAPEGISQNVRKISLGPIIGGALGALVILLGALLAYYAYRLRKRDRITQYTHPQSSTATHFDIKQRHHNHNPSTATADTGGSSDMVPHFLPSSKLARYRQHSPASPQFTSEVRDDSFTSRDLQSPVHATLPLAGQILPSEDVIMHQDSGIRNVMASELSPQRRVEVPPVYTPL